MVWYDTFASFYDSSLEKIYWESRQRTAEMLALQPGDTVLDIGCGTGANFPHLFSKERDIKVHGLDSSEGMLKKASRTAEKNGWDSVQLTQSDARKLDRSLTNEQWGITAFDKIICTLGLSVFPEWDAVLRNAIGLLENEGTMVIMDLFAEKRTFQTWMVEKISGADANREIASTFEGLVKDYRYEEMPAKKSTVGGTLFAVCGNKR